jgi:hypothetical protein
MRTFRPVLTFVLGAAFLFTREAGAQLRLTETGAPQSKYISFQAPASVPSNLTWIFPGTDGAPNQCLATNGSGTLGWRTSGTGYSLDASDGSPTNALYVNAAGNVGIGTTSPGAALEVNGIAQADRVYSTADIPNGGGYNYMLSRSDSTKQALIGFNKAGVQQFTIGQNSTSDNLQFGSFASGGFLFTGGNVGIGTAPTTNKLEVTGTVAATTFSLGLQIVTNACTVPAGAGCTATATCPGGKSLLGGGFSNSWVDITVLASYPSSTTAWSCHFWSTSSGGVSPTCYALCAKVQ